MLASEIDDMVAGYLDAAKWAETNTEVDEDGNEVCVREIDSYHAEWEDDAKAIARDDCKMFLVRVIKSDHPGDLKAMSAEHMGHNFWLTRRHHGTGFWDRNLGDVGDRLTKIANSFDECVSPYVTDDNTIDWM